MVAINKSQLLDEVKKFLTDLDIKQPKHGSLEWYLRNHLNDYLSSVEHADNPNDLKAPTRILSRFCVESMDWDTSLYKRCSLITGLGCMIAKNSNYTSWPIACTHLDDD